jgi:hypothetical protein
MSFESYHDWAILADYFDITITEEELESVKADLKDKNLYVSGDEKESGIRKKLSISELGIMAYQFDSVIRDNIKKQKLKNKIFQLAVDYTQDAETDEESIKAIRNFINGYVESSNVYSSEFWKKISEIEDDYTFLIYTAKNIKSLWY